VGNVEVDIVGHQNVIVSDTLDSDHLTVAFHKDRVKTGNLLEAVEQ
jgi:hypothetical protein